MMSCYADRSLVIEYGDILLPEGKYEDGSFATSLSPIMDRCHAGDQLIGVLPWKLVKFVDTPVEREVGYLNKWLPKINEVSDFINSCRELPYAAKVDKYNKFQLSHMAPPDIENNFI
jgi:hypothetical protein